MASHQPTTPLARAADLLRDGPAPAPRRTRAERLRRRLRALLLRGVRPYSHYQRELDTAVLASLEQHEQGLKSLRERHTEQIERLEDLTYELIVTADALRRGTEGANRGIDQLTSELRAVPYMAGRPFEHFDSPLGEVMGYRTRFATEAGDSSYAAFEDVFRGPAERVADLQRPYLALVREHQPVLDVGCGRGEFLSLAAGEGIAVEGVDTDPGMVERCRALGLKVHEADASEHLLGLEDATLGSVFSAQVIEHLPYVELRRLLELARRKLKPAGLFVAETVNPHSLPALKTFWVDPTHQHPIFPEVALVLCATAGFGSAYVLAPGHDSFERARFEATSYAVVATSAGGQPQELAPRP
jgi:SAM-dependent methyltransferase